MLRCRWNRRDHTANRGPAPCRPPPALCRMYQPDTRSHSCCLENNTQTKHFNINLLAHTHALFRIISSCNKVSSCYVDRAEFIYTKKLLMASRIFFKCNFARKRPHINLAFHVYYHHQTIQLLLTVDQLHSAFNCEIISGEPSLCSQFFTKTNRQNRFQILSVKVKKKKKKVIKFPKSWFGGIWF